jgi:membrane protein YdbS with pleckstrin-like domain
MSLDSDIAHPSVSGTPVNAVDTVADGIDRKLDPRFVTLQRRAGLVSTATRSLVLFGGGVGVMTLGLDHPAAVFGTCGVIAVLLLIHSQWWPAVAYARASYRVDGGGIEIRRGVLWRTVTTVPRSRVQHTDVTQGPFERQLGLGTLVVHTAGNAHAQVHVRGLEYERAVKIRTHLLPRNERDVV